MTARSRRRHRSGDDAGTEAEKILELMYAQGKAQFGDAMKSFWLYDGDLCPGCLARPIDRIKFKGKDAVSINGFIYRPRGVLIGYFLCEVCAKYIFKEAEKNPYKETPLHADIERNLADAYLRYLSSLDA
ncbi:MAG: hypothetical protein HUU11_02780 [Anaerolineales bacterium]|nr:hypothetical protein [Anaerolineales bacterium]NUQ83615.1 hypothetical protein [Anaerolineales bacterium]